MHAPIWLKFGIRNGDLKVSTSFNFGVNLINIEGVKRNFMQKAKAIFCHGYKINCFKEQAENRYVATVQLTGNITRRYSRVSQWHPPRGPNAEMPCTIPASNCVDNRQPREYF